jgi:predicted PP-loop superfamily ATPase
MTRSRFPFAPGAIQVYRRSALARVLRGLRARFLGRTNG